MQVTLLAAVSADGFIADANGNGDFSGPEDKAHLRSFLKSDACDCFICGRKTAEEFQDKLTTKPLLILTRDKKAGEANRIYFSNLTELQAVLTSRNLSLPVLLGGAETYSFFLENDCVDRIALTTEDLIFGKGKKLDIRRIESDFLLQKKERLSDKTVVSFYVRKKPR